MRRVDCRRCGAVVVEEVPWGDGKRTLTKAYMLFLARWARRLSWKETAEAFRTSWDKVFDAVEHAVTWGLEHRMVGQIDAIGVDEVQYSKGHKALSFSTNRDVAYGAAFAFVKSGFSTEAEPLIADLAKRFSEDSYVKFTYLPVVRALTAIGRRQPAVALALLEPAVPYELGIP